MNQDGVAFIEDYIGNLRLMPDLSHQRLRLSKMKFRVTARSSPVLDNLAVKYQDRQCDEPVWRFQQRFGCFKMHLGFQELISPPDSGKLTHQIVNLSSGCKLRESSFKDDDCTNILPK